MTSQNDTAVVQCITASHLPLALYLAWHICVRSSNRTFDVIIFSPEDMVLPDAFA